MKPMEGETKSVHGNILISGPRAVGIKISRRFIFCFTMDENMIFSLFVLSRSEDEIQDLMKLNTLLERNQVRKNHFSPSQAGTK
ncbi:MAG: hypothetical protein KKD56_04415 [Acidobacteria bacterium]|nr:hypothetical protein [Acidobacteriota bacterium]MBU1474130.1 hypothetical protein [Acidobacteriota bacterium]MBU4203062.1 hypothetical protein [Acidobacteriota bacterium]MBU4494287.1 hypothetical protein [Acidobacteriota bacterium]MCG2816114.1 hypothetical protein [Candidatus Aminicenantes bacterium]